MGLIERIHDWTGAQIDKSMSSFIGPTLGHEITPGEIDAERQTLAQRESRETVRAFEMLPETNYRDLYRVYRQISWVRACVDVIVKMSIARGFTFEATKENADPKNRDRLEEFFEQPNPQETASELFSQLFTDQEIFGDHFWEIVRGSDKLPIEIWGMDSITTRIRADEHGRIIGYVNKVENRPAVPLRPDEVVHFKKGSLIVTVGGRMGRSLYGLSPLESLLLVAEQDLWAQLHNKAFFKNGAKVRGMYTFGSATREQVNRNREWLEQISKNPRWTHRDIVLQGKDVKWQAIGTSPKDMEFQALRKFNRDEILAVYQVPPSLIAIIETGNIGSGSGETQQENFKESVIIPTQQAVAQRINHQFIRRSFGITDWKIRFNVPEIVGEKAQAEIDKIYLDSGVLQPSDLREEVLRKRLGNRRTITKALKPSDISVRSGRTIRMVQLVQKFETDVERVLKQQVEALANAFTQETSKALAHDIAEATKGKPFQFHYTPVRWGMTIFKRYTWPTFVKQQSEFEAALNALDVEAFAGVLAENFVAVGQESIEATRRQLNLSGGAAMATAVRQGLLADAQELAGFMHSSLTDTARAEIIEGIEGGESISELKRRIQGLDGYKVENKRGGSDPYTRQKTSAKIAETIARTESRRIFTNVAKGQMRDNGITQVRWLTTGDPDEICAPLQNHIFDINAVPFDGGPPAHHNCKCALQPVIPGEA